MAANSRSISKVASKYGYAPSQIPRRGMKTYPLSLKFGAVARDQGEISSLWLAGGFKYPPSNYVIIQLS